MLRQYSGVTPILEGAEGPIYNQITDAIIKQIQSGKYKAGVALPGSRVLAEKLNVSRQTVIQALEGLVSRGWLYTIPQKGTFVSPENKWPVARAKVNNTAEPSFTFNHFTSTLMNLKIGVRPDMIHFDDGFADLKLSPVKELMTAYRSIYEQHLRIKKTERFFWDWPEQLRQELNLMLQQHRGIGLGEENSCFVRGNQMTFFLMIYTLIAKGDTIAVENPGNLFAWDILKQAGASLLPVRVDEQGIDTETLEKLCQSKKIKAVYVTPQCQYPTTVILSAERRRHLVELAVKYDFVIIESDYEHEFWFSNESVLPMAADYPETVIYTGSLSRMLNPLMRIGFITGPAAYIRSLKALTATVDSCGDFVLEKTVATLMSEGIINRYIRKSAVIYKERRDLMGKLLKQYLGEEAKFTVPPGGLAYWISFNFLGNIEALPSCLSAHKISVPPISLYNFPGEIPLSALRLGFSAINTDEIETAIKLLRNCLRQLSSS